MNRIVIFDLDETLCNTQHRIHHIKKGKHKQYNDLMNKDIVYKDAQGLFKDTSLDSETAMYISTARPCTYLEETYTWLRKNDIYISVANIYMREVCDERSDSMVKSDNLKRIRGLHRKGIPVLAFEDRHKIIRMYRSQGVTALQIRKGEY